MTVAFLLDAGAPLIERLFPAASLAERIQLTPLLIVAMLDFCLAAAFLALFLLPASGRPAAVRSGAPAVH